jgi:hypothetical protein
VLGNLIKRLFNGIILLLAALAFFFVPVGRKTAAQHLVAIFTTTPAREAATAFAGAAKLLAARVATEVERATKRQQDSHPPAP